MPWETIVSHIPFKNQQPIINLAPRYVTSSHVTFMKSSGAGQYYIDPMGSCYTGFSEGITGVTNTGRLNLIMQWTVFCEFAQAFPAKKNWIPQPGRVKSTTYDHFEAVLRFGARMLNWLIQCLQNTFTAKNTGEQVILWIYSPLTQWLIEQVCTLLQSHFLPLISPLTLNSGFDYSSDNNCNCA